MQARTHILAVKLLSAMKVTMAILLAGAVGFAVRGTSGPGHPVFAASSPAADERSAPDGEPLSGVADRSLLLLEIAFDEEFQDTSPAGRRCTVHGTVERVAGRNGQCAAFTGDGWIDTGVPQADLADEFTVECWVKPDSQQHVHADILGNHTSNASGFVLQQDAAHTNEFYAAYGAGDGKWVLTEPVRLLANQWQHVAVVKTREQFSLYVNGVLAASREVTVPMAVSNMPVAVGNGYAEHPRCFRGMMDDVRIWKTALAGFAHAGIDPADARRTRMAQFGAEPRPAAGSLKQAWRLATDDTQLTVGVTDASELVIAELSCPSAGWNWIGKPVAMGLLPQVQIGDQVATVRWNYRDAELDEREGRQLTVRFYSDEPSLELVSRWHARPGAGPIHHSMEIVNRSDQAVTVGEQATFDLDVVGAARMWSFHSDGITPDPVGVYCQDLTADAVGQRHSVRTDPGGSFIPYVVLESVAQHGLYFGLEWSVCRFDAVKLADGDPVAMRVRGGNVADVHRELSPGGTFQVRPGFVGAYRGDLDDAGNSLRTWLWRYCVPDVLRQDAGYPKVQWNAFGATGKSPGSWDPVETGYYPLIDDIAPLGFEEVMIDVGWWEGSEPDSDPVDWSSGMKKAADYAHARGLRFGLYWTDNLDMADPVQRQQRADRITRLFREYDADLWRSDCTRGEVFAASYDATLGFYAMLDTLARQIPGFEWENCCGGGRIKDYGAMRRAVKIFNSDTYCALHVRQAFFDSSFALHQSQLEGHLGSTDGLYRPRGVAGVRYAFRSTSMGAPEWFLDAPSGVNGSEPWSEEEKQALKACVATYKTRIRPLVRSAHLYHILPRPDGRGRDGIEYYDPEQGKGVVFLFQPASAISDEVVCFKGLDPCREYRVSFEDGSQAATVLSGAALMQQGVRVKLSGDEVSELIFFEGVQ